jgi:predicted RNase H-like HicB family nuclease
MRHPAPNRAGPPHRRSISHVTLTIQLEEEADGRWIAEVIDLPGTLVYGTTPQEATARAKALALRVLADRLEHGETDADIGDIAFVAA